jgi:hypothetical protein
MNRPGTCAVRRRSPTSLLPVALADRRQAQYSREKQRAERRRDGRRATAAISRWR